MKKFICMSLSALMLISQAGMMAYGDEPETTTSNTYESSLSETEYDVPESTISESVASELIETEITESEHTESEIPETEASEAETSDSEISESEISESDDVSLEANSGLVWWEDTASGKKYLFYYDPVTHAKVTGWKTINGKRYYFFEKGGAALTGLQYLASDEKYYYFSPTTCEVLTGVYPGNIEGQYYFYDPDVPTGRRSGLITYNGNTYYGLPTRSGLIQYGIFYVDGHIYNFDLETGIAYKNTTFSLAHILFTCGPDGAVTSWVPEAGYENNIRTRLILNGMKELGAPYDLTGLNGYACGSFVYYCYNSVGIKLPTNSSFGIAESIVSKKIIGRQLTKDELKPGDLVFWEYEKCGEPDCQKFEKIHHVGVYLGDNTMMEANQSIGYMSIEPLHDYDGYRMKFYGAILTDPEYDADNAAYETNAQSTGTPTLVTAKANANMTVSLSWNVSGTADGYIIYRSENNGTPVQIASISSRSTRSYVDTNIVTGKSYTYQVRCTKNLASETYIGTSVATSNAVKYDNLAAVTNLKAESAGKNKVKLTWSAVSGAEGYLVYAVKDGSYGYVTMTSSGTATTAYDTRALDLDYNYYYVFAFRKNTLNKMCPGNTAKYVYAKGVCPAVTNFRAANLKGGVQLSWTASPTAEGYLVYGIRGDQAYTYIGMTTKTTSFTDKAALKTDYNFYWVFPYHKDSSGKMITGGAAKYVYGIAR